jgi:hypothetical protein
MARIHGAAAAFQYLDAYFGCRRHARAHHPVSRQNFRSRAEIIPGNAIDLCVEPVTNN